MGGQTLEPAQALLQFTLGRGDDSLILGHRLSEWCGHAPILEEDIALSNIALDCLGQAQAWLGLAGELSGEEKSADDLAYFRDARDFRNCLMVEQPNGDFAMTILRQFLFDSFQVVLLQGLTGSSHPGQAAIAAKSLKEVQYHLRHAREWVLRLGDGTEESHRRAQFALDELWRFTDEFFLPGPGETDLSKSGLVPDRSNYRKEWHENVQKVLSEATLQSPREEAPGEPRGVLGFHSEHLGHLLSEMQILARSHPGAKW